MPVIDSEKAHDVVDLDEITGRYTNVDGYTVGFECYKADTDLTPLFAGLPGDACQCPHWGVVRTGTLIFRYTDGSEDVIHAGQAYYAPPGHVPVLLAGTSVVEFSPQEGLNETMAAVMANMERGVAPRSAAGPLPVARPGLVERFLNVVRDGDGTSVEDLYHLDAIVDVNLPAWRYQLQGPRAIAETLRREDLGVEARRCTDWRVEETTHGFVAELEIRFRDHGEDRLWREVHLVAAAQDRIREHVVYCTGHWDAATIARQAIEAPMVRP